ncbi:MAG: hypothetical protein SFX73_20800 [Kofleriaceae bacterium]|nr:hypothetical protein [Kofleriaceae bacterium]
MKSLACFVFVVALTACGDDAGGGTPGKDASGEADAPLSGPLCEQLAMRMCNKARECAPNPNASTACRWYYDGFSSLGRNCVVCEGGLVDRFCNDPTKSMAQVEACSAAFDQAVCETPSGEQPGVRVPEACDVMIPCGEGPCTE